MSTTKTSSLLLANDLPDDIYQKLIAIANQHHRSLAQEIIAILIDNFRITTPTTKLVSEGMGTCLHRRFAQVAGDDLEPPPRNTARHADFAVNNS
jgi:plasmid stability protein